ncbi:GNAT family N-acetyltransferase [Echinicola jeungdonensis]|uniref:GNAT family N-acetyltransferase n=1 Tax=Echinicola jeungdonensis TaxID=709343 RepID=A0ABV5J2J7_9BACT|nr:GNAT family N-acetyltransferase [Echinicola jeungdonensis]MDN3671161.1 GNAT family N-acetyltransferase [Echinicola jeungdonensis]
MKLLLGNNALDYLFDPDIKSKWNRLAGQCQWATAFQQWEFISSWYQLYKDQYQPVLVLENQEGILTGVFPLAMDQKGWIIGAGADQAEYQVWIYQNENCLDFVHKAIQLLWNELPLNGIHLKYLPYSTPGLEFNSLRQWKNRTLLKTHPHPLLLADGEAMSRELGKKNKREKVNRLKRRGALNFERITDQNLFDHIIDDLITQCDFRKGAVYGNQLFSDDPFRKPFLIKLFQLGLLHVTLLKLDEEIIASNVGVMGNKWVHLQGINTHSPFQAKHSPGILHFLMLGQLLEKEGFEVFDLTPGADPYKSMLANQYQEAYELTIGHPLPILKRKWKQGINKWVKDGLKNKGYSDRFLKSSKANFIFKKQQWLHIIKQGPIFYFKKLLLNKNSSESGHLWKIEKNGGFDSVKQNGLNLEKNNLKDLLKYDPKGELVTKQAFLMDCMKRLEEGQQVYTYTKNNKLDFLVWLTHQPQSIIKKSNKLDIKTPSCLIYNFYYRVKGQNNGPLTLLAIKDCITHNLDKNILILSNQDYFQNKIEGFEIKPVLEV